MQLYLTISLHELVNGLLQKRPSGTRNYSDMILHHFQQVQRTIVAIAWGLQPHPFVICCVWRFSEYQDWHRINHRTLLCITPRRSRCQRWQR